MLFIFELDPERDAKNRAITNGTRAERPVDDFGLVGRKIGIFVCIGVYLYPKYTTAGRIKGGGLKRAYDLDQPLRKS
jgi:hypothetical protein